jgi:hypothetical protein
MSIVAKTVIHRCKRPGPAGSGLLTLPHADLRFRSEFDADYSLPVSHLLKVAAPKSIQVHLCASNRSSMGPDYEELPRDQATQVCEKIDDERSKRGLPKKGIIRHVYTHVTFGPQAVYHHPFSTGRPGDPIPSLEADATLQGDVTLVLHDTDDDGNEESGLEFALAVQGSGNWFIIDPNQSDPTIAKSDIDKERLFTQGQLQLQAAYVFKSFEILGLKMQFQFLLQAAGAVGYGYDATKRKAVTSYSASGVLGGELDIDIGHDNNIALQCTGGANTGGTVDGMCGAFLKLQWELGKKKDKKDKK